MKIEDINGDLSDDAFDVKTEIQVDESKTFSDETEIKAEPLPDALVSNFLIIEVEMPFNQEGKRYQAFVSVFIIS